MRSLYKSHFAIERSFELLLKQLSQSQELVYSFHVKLPVETSHVVHNISFRRSQFLNFREFRESQLLGSDPPLTDDEDEAWSSRVAAAIVRLSVSSDNKEYAVVARGIIKITNEDELKTEFQREETKWQKLLWWKSL